jgi:hypothetical protein
MNLNLTIYQVALIQELIYNEIDRCGGIEYISEDVEAILSEDAEAILSEIRAKKAKYGSE